MPYDMFDFKRHHIGICGCEGPRCRLCSSARRCMCSGLSIVWPVVDARFHCCPRGRHAQRVCHFFRGPTRRELLAGALASTAARSQRKQACPDMGQQRSRGFVTGAAATKAGDNIEGLSPALVRKCARIMTRPPKSVRHMTRCERSWARRPFRRRLRGLAASFWRLLIRHVRPPCALGLCSTWHGVGRSGRPLLRVSALSYVLPVSPRPARGRPHLRTDQTANFVLGLAVGAVLRSAKQRCQPWRRLPPLLQQRAGDEDKLTTRLQYLSTSRQLEDTCENAQDEIMHVPNMRINLRFCVTCLVTTRHWRRP